MQKKRNLRDTSVLIIQSKFCVPTAAKRSPTQIDWCKFLLFCPYCCFPFHAFWSLALLNGGACLGDILCRRLIFCLSSYWLSNISSVWANIIFNEQQEEWLIFHSCIPVWDWVTWCQRVPPLSRHLKLKSFSSNSVNADGISPPPRRCRYHHRWYMSQ